MAEKKPKYKVAVSIELGLTRTNYEGREERAVLELETSKHFEGGISSDARVMWHHSSGRTHAFGLGGAGDFSTRGVRDRSARATEKNIDAFHAQVFRQSRIDELTAAAIAHYPPTTFYVVREPNGQEVSRARKRENTDLYVKNNPERTIAEIVEPAYRDERYA